MNDFRVFFSRVRPYRTCMSRRHHANSNDEFENKDYTSGSSQYHNYEYFDNGNYDQGIYDYQSDANYGPHAGYLSNVDNGYNSTQFTNAEANYGYNGQTSSHNPELMNSYTNIKPVAAIPHVSFPTVKASPILQQPGMPANYGTQYNYGSTSGKSWLLAFSSGGFDNEPPLLEELGINFSHIKNKTLASINPFRKLDSGTLNDADLTGPLLFCFLFGTSLLLTGKIHFGYIYGVATLGWISIFTILNLMTENGVNFYLTASVLGYCLLPMVLLSALAVLLKLRGIVGLILGITSVSWCTFSSSTYFVAAFGMHNQQILIAYPIFLLYSCFALMTIF